MQKCNVMFCKVSGFGAHQCHGQQEAAQRRAPNWSVNHREIPIDRLAFFYFRNFARDVEKATEPIMDRARQIKEEVSQATGEIKTRVDQNNETIRNKTGKMGQ